jgi:hypothetical protein
MSTDPNQDRLWGPAESAAFQGYRETTIWRKVTEAPHTLPPRVLA